MLEGSAGSRSPTLLDVRNAALVDAFVGRVAQEQGKIDIVVNNAAGTFHAHFMDVNAKGEGSLIAENFGTVTNFVRAAVPVMPAGRVDHQRHVDRGPPRRARLRRLRGHEGRGRQPHEDPRARARAARHPRERDRARRDPHAGRRSARRRGDPGRPESYGRKVPLDWGDVDDCAGAAVYLASNLAKWVTGTTLHVDGGAFASSGWVRQDDGVPAVTRQPSTP